ncbi:aldo/keto reductase [Pseudonocardia phyllosphaerae]|uniref:aldo/keto reductase n=1 Tax=Pseudonocardia phyllosphaerae TaxID=3390502 RepID=UPI00397D7EE7
MAPDATVTLPTGAAMPRLGFGVSESRDAHAAVGHALELGYRSIDTAAVYENEAAVGAALAGSGIPRDELFVTTKVWNVGHGRTRALDAAARGLDRLGLDHVDLLLVHWPNDAFEHCLGTWEAMGELLGDGRARAVGVSNFRPSHLHRLLSLGGPAPAVNQVELHPHLQQHELRALHERHGIVTEAWSPLGRGAVLDEPVLAAIAAAHDATPAQVVLAWHLQQGRVVIPKSDDPVRIAENRAAASVHLDDDELAAVDALHVRGGAGRIGPVAEDLAA